MADYYSFFIDFLRSYGIVMFISIFVSMTTFLIYDFIKNQYFNMIMNIKFHFDKDTHTKGLYYKTICSSGMDIYPKKFGDIVIKPHERVLIKTGLHFDYIPPDFEVQVRSRSGLALKKGIMVLNSPGTIDEDYRGDVGVILYNSSNETVLIEEGKAIAQLVIAKTYKLSSEGTGVTYVKNRIRGNGGFGSTDDIGGK